ncbi:hypothetical protein MTCD1_03026 [Colwellia marinimaniae]|uniref:Uncharacterized protein n=1 Tax=Colwellia marinimaniae TaxID=1513592 RepID=A0ABQ0MYE4_9GAMM|nr:hypothetical protein MTCD1_03026 [Colwellia marinimaniae]
MSGDGLTEIAKDIDNTWTESQLLIYQTLALFVINIDVGLYISHAFVGKETKNHACNAIPRFR